MRVYLAGPINGTTDAEANDWRQEMHLAFAGNPSVDLVNPMDRDYRGRESENVKEIVEGDKRSINECRLVIANCWQPSIGTAMEIHYAYTRGIDVWAIVPLGKPVSPWLAYHARIYPSISGVIFELERRAY